MATSPVSIVQWLFSNCVLFRGRLSKGFNQTRGRMISFASNECAALLHFLPCSHGGRHRYRLRCEIILLTSDWRIVWSSCGCAITRGLTTRSSGFVSWLSMPASRKRCGDVSFTKSQAKPAVEPAVVLSAAHAFSEWLVVVKPVVQHPPASQSVKPMAAFAASAAFSRWST